MEVVPCCKRVAALGWSRFILQEPIRKLLHVIAALQNGISCLPCHIGWLLLIPDQAVGPNVRDGNLDLVLTDDDR